MKQIFQIFSILLLTIPAMATIRRVNNTPGLQGVYPNINQAISFASPGDTIHIEPSGIDYLHGSSIFINMKLTILGNGSNLYNNPGLQADTNTVSIRFMTNSIGIRFTNGSEGSYISCNVENIFIEQNSITVDKCYVSGVLKIDNFFSGSNQIIISRSYIGQLRKDNTTPDGWFKKCIIKSYLTYLNSLIFENCIVGTDNSTTGLANNCIFTKCIFTSVLASNLGFNSCTLDSNIFSSSTFPLGLSGSDSLHSLFINQTSIFHPFPAVVENIKDINYKFKPTFDPINKGPYVGNKPYTFGTIPAIPSIYELTLPSTYVNGGPGNTLPITISTRGNQ